jgi:hypothetical protein
MESSQTVIIATGWAKEDQRGDHGYTFTSLLHQPALWRRAVNTHYFYNSAFSTLCFILSAKDGKIEQYVCIKFRVKFGKYANETLCNDSWGFWRTCFKPESGFWMAFTFEGRLSIVCRWRTFRTTKHQQKRQKMFKNLKAHPRWLLPNNPWASRHCWEQLWSLPGDLTENWTDAFITTMFLPTCSLKPQSLWLTTTWLSFPILPTRWS